MSIYFALHPHCEYIRDSNDAQAGSVIFAARTASAPSPSTTTAVRQMAEIAQDQSTTASSSAAASLVAAEAAPTDMDEKVAGISSVSVQLRGKGGSIIVAQPSGESTTAPGTSFPASASAAGAMTLDGPGRARTGIDPMGVIRPGLGSGYSSAGPNVGEGSADNVIGTGTGAFARPISFSQGKVLQFGL